MALLSNHPLDNCVQAMANWVEQIIVGLNFCPFAKKEMVNNSIYYYLSEQKKLKSALEEFAQQCQYLIEHPDIETTLIIYQLGFADFERYLDLVDYCNDLIVEIGLDGVFQIASFHPQYCFEGEEYDDPSNFTNRSPYPTIHLIREESMAKVLSVYKNPEQIPEDNIELARMKGKEYFELILKRLK